MVTLQSVQRHIGLTHHFYVLTFGQSGAQAERKSDRMSKNKNGALNQYDAERFVRLTFATIRKHAGMQGLTSKLQFFSIVLVSWCSTALWPKDCLSS